MSYSRGARSIGEVLSVLKEEFDDISISKIRFLESQGLISPERSPSGYRKFTERDVNRLRFILREQQEHFLPLKIIKAKLDQAEADHQLESLTPLIDLTHSAHQSAGALSRKTVSVRTFRNGAAPIIEDPPQVSFDDEDGDLAGAPAPASSAPNSTPTRRFGGLAAVPTNSAATPARHDHGLVRREDMLSLCELTESKLRELEQYGLIRGHRSGSVVWYDDDAIEIARLAAQFLRFGVEPRHLRQFRHSADREADLYRQVVVALRAKPGTQARKEADIQVARLIALGTAIHAQLLRHALEEG